MPALHLTVLLDTNKFFQDVYLGAKMNWILPASLCNSTTLATLLHIISFCERGIIEYLEIYGQQIYIFQCFRNMKPLLRSAIKMWQKTVCSKVCRISYNKPDLYRLSMKCRFEWTQQMTYVTFTLIPALTFCFVYLGNMKVRSSLVAVLSHHFWDHSRPK